MVLVVIVSVLMLLVLMGSVLDKNKRGAMLMALGMKLLLVVLVRSCQLLGALDWKVNSFF